jgi:hypothetical protein
MRYWDLIGDHHHADSAPLHWHPAAADPWIADPSGGSMAVTITRASSTRHTILAAVYAGDAHARRLSHARKSDAAGAS